MLCKVTRWFGLATELGPFRQRLPRQWELGVEVRCHIWYRYSCGHPRCVSCLPPNLHGGGNTGLRDRWVRMCTSAATRWPFRRFQVEMAIFPLASAGVSVGSPCQGSWSLPQEAKEKDTRERWGGGREERATELVKFQSPVFRSLNLITDVIRAQCFLKPRRRLTHSLPSSLLPSVPLSWASEDGVDMSPGSLLRGAPRECACRPHWPGGKGLP